MGAEHGTRFSVDVRGADAGVLIGAAGELDVTTAPRLEEAITRAIDAGNDVALDLSGIEFLDSTGLRAVVAGLRHAREAQVGFRLAETSPAVDRLLRITGLAEEF